MTGTLRATFNKLYDNLQGFSICTTAQCFLLQLAHDLQKVPTLDICSMNTDAILYTIEEEYKEEAHKVLHDWEQLTGLELEEDKVVKIIMANVNNYCEIVQVGDDDYKVNYKGGYFNGIHNFKWNKEKHIFEYSFQDGVETNSLTIVSEALLKYFLFDIPIEDTINNCNDIFRFMQVSHLGSTYSKLVQESPNGDIDLPNRNNRVYAGLKHSGLLVKIKSDGRRDSLANCPKNPVVDNDNHLTINDINKEWYIQLAKKWANDFKGVKRLTAYKKVELVEMANNMGLEFDKKIKKEDLIKLIENNKESEIIMAKKETKEINTKDMNIYEKINAMKKDIMDLNFVLDEVLPSNLGGKEYASIPQYYKAINTYSMKYNLLFTWDVVHHDEVEKEIFKPMGKMPQHLYTVECRARFVDLDSYKINENGDDDTNYMDYYTIASGTDMADKGYSIASSMAFRNWFDKNFSPKHLTIEEFVTESSEIVTESTKKTEEPKVPTYIPQEKKEEIIKEVVKEEQKEDKENDDVKRVIDNIMKVRTLLGNDNWGASTLEKLINGEVNSVDLMEIELKVNNKLESLEG